MEILGAISVCLLEQFVAYVDFGHILQQSCRQLRNSAQLLLTSLNHHDRLFKLCISCFWNDIAFVLLCAKSTVLCTCQTLV
jgi:hypothetical protein